MLEPGLLHAHPRAKQLVLACGPVCYVICHMPQSIPLTLFNLQHATIISFALESHIMGMKRSDYDEITSFSVDGSSGKERNLKHSFLIPDRFHEGSSSPSKRTVNILLAWVSDDWVWVLVDFARLARFYIISRDIPWSSADIQPNSDVSKFPCFCLLRC